MNYMYERLPENVKGSLRQVTEKEIITMRLEGKCRVVFKFGEDLYALRAKSGIAPLEVRDILGRHLCSRCEMVCGGELCRKVFDASVSVAEREGYNGREAVVRSKRIEKYPFILVGVEYFNAQREYLIVTSCTKFCKMKGS